jgi:hypothetical protein
MTSFPADRTLLHPDDAKLLRISLTYILPALAVLYVVLAGLWLVPDGYFGMYGNFDGHWASWSARGILEWGRFFDFSPVSPLTGMPVTLRTRPSGAGVLWVAFLGGEQRAVLGRWGAPAMAGGFFPRAIGRRFYRIFLFARTTCS